MRNSLRFWTNVALIAGAHVAIIAGLIRWSRAEKDSSAQSIVWMNGGGGDDVALVTKKSPAPRRESKVEAMKDRDADEDLPVLASAPSEIQLPTATATPVRTPAARLASTPTSTASPKVKGTPKRKPRPTPKPTPKPTPRPPPRIVLAKASPKASAKPEPEKEEDEPAEGPIKKTEMAPEQSPKIEPKKTAATQTATSKGATAGSGGGRAGGSVNQSQFGWYGSMLHDRFYSEWAQPASAANSGAKNSVLVKLRIEKDGRVTSFEIVRGSGNAELDESVKALSSRVTHVEPLPDGLGKGDHYDVKINFELNSE